MSEGPNPAEPRTGSDDVARGAETVVDALETARREGYETQFVARVGGDVRCHSCHRIVNAAVLGVDRVRRLEGPSDAADELIVVWVTCPRCGSRGVITLGYGPNASAEDVAVLRHLSLDHADHSPVPSERPGGGGR